MTMGGGASTSKRWMGILSTGRNLREGRSGDAQSRWEQQARLVDSGRAVVTGKRREKYQYQ